MPEVLDELPRTLLSMITEEKLQSLHLKVEAGWTEDFGMIRHEGVPYVWSLTWTEIEGTYDFLLEVFRLVPKTRSNGKVRNDRPPSLALVASHQFEQEVANVE